MYKQVEQVNFFQINLWQFGIYKIIFGIFSIYIPSPVFSISYIEHKIE